MQSIQGAKFKVGHPHSPPTKGLSRKGTAPLKVEWMGEGKRPKNEQLSGGRKRKTAACYKTKPNFISLLLPPSKCEDLQAGGRDSQNLEIWAMKSCGNPGFPVGGPPPFSHSFLKGLSCFHSIGWEGETLPSFRQPLTQFQPRACLPPDIVWRGGASLLQIHT